MSTSRKNLETASTSLGKLENDLKNAENLLNAWAGDPAGIFVRYGIASNEEDVKVRDVTSWCGCGCTPKYEFEFEYSDNYAPAAFTTVDRG